MMGRHVESRQRPVPSPEAGLDLDVADPERPRRSAMGDAHGSLNGRRAADRSNRHSRTRPRRRWQWLGRHSVRAAWTRWARRVGVQFTFHDLRHFFCSTLLSQGINPKAVAKVAGHSSAVVTLSTYAHVMPDDDDRIRRALTQTVAPVIALRTG
jgi:integrase